MQRASIFFFSTLPLATLSCLIPLTTVAQVTPDGTTNTKVNVDGNNFTIEQGDRVGDNLFHSFDKFSVPTGGEAFFNNTISIENIFSRVTGISISNIDGLLRANGAANLFLINPNGIVFGPNARLNIGGSFFASTADSLLFEGNAEFSASNPQAPPLLKVSIPIGINFRDNPGDIVNRSNLRETETINQGTELEINRIGLEVNQGKNITLIGGNIFLEDTGITAPGGRVDLGGLSTAGRIGINADGSLSFPDGIARADVSLSNEAKVNISAGGGGFINVNTRNLTLSDQSILLGGIAENTGSVDAQAGDITINATSVVGKGNSIISTATDGIGNAGDINITTSSLEFTDELKGDDLASRLIASTFGQGNAGNITVNAEGNISFDGSGGGIFSTVGVRGNDNNTNDAIGHAGNIRVHANSVSITNGAGFIVSTNGKGNAGNILINARNNVTTKGLGDRLPQFNNILRPSGLKTQVRSDGLGDGGEIRITADNNISLNGSQVLADTQGNGNAGNIIIKATDVSLEPKSLILSQVQEKAQGDGGEIQITADNKISLNDSQVLADTKGNGDAGNTIIKATDVSLNDSRVLADTQGNGNAGNIEINTSSVNITNFSNLSANTFGAGKGGNIAITLINDGSFDGAFNLLSNSSILSITFGTGDAGNIAITLINDGSFDGAFNLSNSSILSSTFGTGDAGNIEISASSVDITDFSTLSTDTSGAGDAGDVKITTGSLSLKKGGQVTVRTFGEGNAGDLIVHARESILISGVTDNNPSRLSATALQSNGKGGNINVFTNQLNIDKGGTIEAGNFDSSDNLDSGTGKPGNIEITANALSLNQARIDAATQSETGDGANIILQLTGDLRLSNNSLISAFAEGEANGGNILINAQSIIADPSQVPDDGNDIVASADKGDGGIIILPAFLDGIEPRDAEPENGTNDIDASSESGSPGEISISEILIELPEDVLDATDQISQNPCEQGVGSEFIVTGKGGLRPNPHGTLSSDSVQVALVEPIPSQQEDRESKSLETTTPEAVPAQGWIFTDTGEVMLTSYVPSAMAEAIPSTPLAQAPTNPAQLTNQAEKLYQNQEFDEAANLWSQAAQAFAASGDNLNQAMAWSNLALTYQQLGKWENINQAIQNSLTALNTAPENSHLVAQTLDIQGKLQRETGQPAAAIDTWQKAANIYQKLGESAALTQNSLNQAQAFQDLGLYSRACQTILASLRLENIATCQDLDGLTTEELNIKLDKITAQPSVQKVWGLRKLGHLMLLIGQPQKSRQILEASLTLAKQLNSPSEIAATYLSIGKNYHAFTTKEAEPSRTKRKENQQQALEAYEKAIDQLQDHESSPPSPPSLGGTRYQSPPSLGEDSQGSPSLGGTRYQSPPGLGDLGGKNPRDETQETDLYRVASLGEDSQSPPSLGEDSQSSPSLGGTRYQSPPGLGDLGGKDPRDETQETYTYTVDLITQQQAKLNQFSLLLQLEKWSEAAALGTELLTQIANLPSSRSNIYAQINFAHTLIELLKQNKPQPPAEIKLPSNSEIDRILTKAIENARILGDQRSQAYAFGDRGRLYELTGELALAEQSTQQAIALISTLDSPDIAYQYLWQLGRIQNRQGDLEKAIAAYTKAYNALQSLRSDLASINPGVRFAFRDRVEPVYRELVALNFQYAQTLGNKANTKDNQEAITTKLIQARDVMESLQLSQLQNFFREACIVANPQQIDKIDPNAAVIYTIVLPDKLGILLSLPNQPPKLYTPVKNKETQEKVTQTDISEAVDKIRSSLLSPEEEPGTEYKQLYDWLIRDLEAELEKNQVKTIAFVLDEELRNIPMSVLHDGQQYLIEKYALALTSGLQLLDPKPLTEIEVNAIAAGLSKNQDGSDLPGIAAELQAMQEMGLTDNYLLNEEFTKQALEKNIVNSNSPIVHLATLAQFSPKAEDTFILAWDNERINIKEFADLLRESTFKRQKAIELLVLSAGETASGDSRANLGLAGVALQAGVRSTLATVWPVVDESTAKIMERFYLELQQATTTKINKAEALRRAQRTLINDKDQQFNHPHYWAPFILIGNWQ